MLVVTRFQVEDAATFRTQADLALAAFAARPGFVRGRVGRAADDPRAFVLTTEWTGVGAYRRSLSAYDVKVDAAPLLAQGYDEPSAFEVLLSYDAPESAEAGPVQRTEHGSRRALDADEVGLGEASGPASAQS